MEILIIVLAAIVLSTYFYISQIRYQKARIKKWWGKSPDSKIAKDLDEDKLIKSMKTLIKHIPGKYIVDSITWRDLEFIKIFNRINNTKTFMGQDYLYTMLRNFGGPNYEADTFQKIKDYFDQNPRDREKAEFIFARTGRNKENIILEYIENTDSKEMSAPWLYLGLSLISIFLVIASIVGYITKAQYFPKAILLTVMIVIINSMIFALESKKIKDRILATGYLGHMINKSKDLSKFDLANKDELITLTKDLGSISFWSNFRMLETIDISIYFISQIQNIFLLPIVSYSMIINKLSKNKDQMIKLYMEFGKIEAAIAVLNYEKLSQHVERPSFTDKKEITASKVYHPILQDPVGNPVDFRKINLVTGSNASGKSTYVKSIAINAILGQTINLVNAENFSMKKGRVLTSMAISDDIEAGDSYFIAEIKSLKRIVEDSAVNSDSYYFIDEILKGTNTIERISASSAIIEDLIEKEALAYVATHDIELTQMFADDVENIHFREDVDENEGIKFDYKLHQGPSNTTNAIKLLKTMGFPEKIVEAANARVRRDNKNYTSIYFIGG